MEEKIEEYEENYANELYDNYKTDIVTTIAYLLGVKSQILESETQRFKKEIIETLEKNINAVIIRALSILRYEFIRNHKEIKERNRELVPIESMNDIISTDLIRFLRENNIEIIHVNVSVTMHIAYLNQEILERIESIKPIIPTWIKWEFIKSLFTMPGCYSGHYGINIQNKDQAKKINEQIHKMRKLIYSAKAFYPYGIYLYWPEDKMKPYYGNLLLNDEKFLKILYSAYNETFHANQYVIDATTEDKNSIYSFIDEAINIAILVDCENVDPYRFASVFKNLEEDNLKKIKKVILYDDVNTSSAWDYISKMIHLPIEHEETERLLNTKSLVDIAMATGACKEFYQENTESLILASSDSDFWGLIQNLPTARYMVLNESDKTSHVILEKFIENNIPYCFMDSFAQSAVQDFKDIVLFHYLQKKIKEFNDTGYFANMNPYGLVDTIFQEAHIQGSYYQIETEKKAFFDKYLKKGLKINVEEENDHTCFKMELAGIK